MVVALCLFWCVWLLWIICECVRTQKAQVSGRIMTDVTRKAGLAWILKTIASES